jgi:hypothetical protein
MSPQRHSSLINIITKKWFKKHNTAAAPLLPDFLLQDLCTAITEMILYSMMVITVVAVMMVVMAVMVMLTKIAAAAAAAAATTHFQ